MTFNITASDGSVCTKFSKANVAIYITRSQYTAINLGENDLEFFADPGDWVDLGLPSGLLWATRNVGATSPEDYGDYFAWGETTPKSVYDLDTYIYYLHILPRVRRIHQILRRSSLWHCRRPGHSRARRRCRHRQLRRPHPNT